jgi:hypothetical protein
MVMRTSRLTWCNLETSIISTATDVHHVNVVFITITEGITMKNVLTKLVIAGAAVYGVVGEALANGYCGWGSYPACEVPEPSSSMLFLGAAGVAALVIKLRKKK